MRTCLFCNHTTTVNMSKPLKINTRIKSEKQTVQIAQIFGSSPRRKQVEALQAKTKKVGEADVYSTTKDIFLIKNKDNVLASTIKDTPKVIKNNKKKKDKFAGLCKQAVFASSQLTKEKKTKNKLDLFLKPSS